MTYISVGSSVLITMDILVGLGIVLIKCLKDTQDLCVSKVGSCCSGYHGYIG